MPLQKWAVACEACTSQDLLNAAANGTFDEEDAEDEV